ncbi:MAG: alpha/beta fold hydrolase [Pseudomonadota bacterium]
MTALAPVSVDTPSGLATFLRAGPKTSRAVILLHGGGLDSAALSWRLLIPELARAYRVIAPNWPGYGGSAAFARPYTIADIGAWLMGVLDAVEIERASFLGISMGGGAALWAAVNRPARVDAIIPVGAYGVADRAPLHLLSFLLTRLPLNRVYYAMMRKHPQMLKRAVEGLFADPEKVTPALLSEVRGALADAGDGEAFTDFQRGEITPRRLRTVFTPNLNIVRTPALFIHGKSDPLVPLAAVEDAAEAMPNARLHVMDAGHWPMRERPHAFNETVLAFLDKVTA